MDPFVALPRRGGGGGGGGGIMVQTEYDNCCPRAHLSLQGQVIASFLSIPYIGPISLLIWGR